MVDAEQAADSAQTGAFQIELEGAGAQLGRKAERPGLRGEVAGTAQAAAAAAAGFIQAAPLDNVGLPAVRARGMSFVSHALSLAILRLFRHSPPGRAILGRAAF